MIEGQSNEVLLESRVSWEFILVTNNGRTEGHIINLCFRMYSLNITCNPKVVRRIISDRGGICVDSLDIVHLVLYETKNNIGFFLQDENYYQPFSRKSLLTGTN